MLRMTLAASAMALVMAASASVREKGAALDRPLEVV